MFESNKKLEEYITKYTENEDDILKELNRKTFLETFNPRMICSPLQGKILQMLSNMISPKYILEIGTFTGYSAICLARGLKKDGKLFTIEINDELTKYSQNFFEKAKLQNNIVQKVGDALEIIPKIDKNFDLVFIDADKERYLDYYKMIFDKVNIGGFIIADNVLWEGKVVEENLPKNDFCTRVILELNSFVNEDDRVENVIFPIRDGLMVLRKIWIINYELWKRQK